MTRGDFILGILSSLTATILYELTRKFYPKLKIKTGEFNKRFIATITTGRLVLSSCMRVAAHRLLAIRISPYIVLRWAIIIAVLLSIPLDTYSILSTNDEKDVAIIKETSVTIDITKSGEIIIGRKRVDTEKLRAEIDMLMAERMSERRPCPNAAVNRERLNCE